MIWGGLVFKERALPSDRLLLFIAGAGDGQCPEKKR